MKTMWEPEWHKILIANLNNAIKQCQDAGIQILDCNDEDWQLDNVRYSPEKDKVYMSCKETN